MIKQIVKTVLDPLGIVVIVALLIAPVITVVSLSPKTPQKDNNEVLGLKDDVKSTYSLEIIGGVHSYIETPKLALSDNIRNQYSINLNQRAAGTYSRPILKIINETDTDKRFYFNGSLETNRETKVGIIYMDNNYIIQSENFDFFRPSITVKGNSSETLFLSIENSQNILYSDTLNFTISSE